MEGSTRYRLHVFIDGRVQGVGFRNFAAARAEMLGLTGWVRNYGENQVEVVAEGDMERLTTFLEYLRHGPRAAFVTQVNPSWEISTGEFVDFDIGYSV
jgi:acylphosphatase